MLFRKSQTSAAVDEGSVLLLQIPRTNEKKELAAEQMFASIHGLLITAQKTFFKSSIHERISFEIIVQAKRICFYVWVPEHLKTFVEEQIYAQYPTVHISEVEDYTKGKAQMYPTRLVSELKFTANEALPIKTFPSFEVDPLAAITATLAKFEDDEEAWFQLVLKPAADNWHKKSEKYIHGIRNKAVGGPGLLATAMSGNDAKATGGAEKLTEFETSRAGAAETKAQKLAYEVCLRLVYMGNYTPQQARMRLQAITASFKQFNTTYLNGFTQRYIKQDDRFLELYKTRNFWKDGFICNIEEVASLYHLPHTNVETPNILWSSAKTAEPPANLPMVTDATRETSSPIAITNFRGHNTMFGMPRVDRGRHLYIIGQTGTGKSGLLELLTISDIYSPYGFAVIDPHGDYAINILKRIPAERAKDVIYFNPSDTDFPIAFNPMEVTDQKLKTHTASELIGVLKRMFESWGPRLEYILRYSLLALLDYPDATMLDITRILTDKKFRADVLTHVQDPVVRNFWQIEFASWNDKFAAEAVAPVLNKVGAFTANPVVRNIIGQPKSSFNIRQMMDERKIIIVNLSRGLIGEDNAALLGALMVTKIQMAAMSRADQAQADRVPFYLYVDEFQNFATDSFATILSEARKYALNLTVANQYIAQMMDTVKDAVFGNVGSIISFRTSADDARTMQKYFEPQFDEHDIVHMHNRHFAISMTIEGEKVQAFSATTLDLPAPGQDYSDEIIANSRQSYAVARAGIETFMNERYVTPSKQATTANQHTPRRTYDGGGVEQLPAAEASDTTTVAESTAPKEPTTPRKVAKDILNLAGASKPKRKRTRSRRKKSDSSVGMTATQKSDKSDNDETVLRLR